MSDAKVSEMAGDLAEYVGEHLQRLDGGGWMTDEATDAYVIEHVQRLDADQQRRMRALATTLMGLTASALARAGTAPWVQEVFTDNDEMAAMRLEVVKPEEYDRG